MVTDAPTRTGSDDDVSLDVDDSFRALLEGLRTTLPGVQVLFAFLLTAPLQAGFDGIDDRQRLAFLVAFYASGLASVLLIAPSVHQRMRAPATGVPRRSVRHLRVAIWVAIVGTISMGIAIAATVYLVSDLVVDTEAAVAAMAALLAVLGWAWFVLPLVHFPRMDGRAAAEEAAEAHGPDGGG